MAEAMSDLQIIEAALQQAARRSRWARALRGLWRGLLVGAVLSLVVIGVWHLLPLPFWTLAAAALVPFPCALAGMIIGGWPGSAGSAEGSRWSMLKLWFRVKASVSLFGWEVIAFGRLSAN